MHDPTDGPGFIERGDTLTAVDDVDAILAMPRFGDSHEHVVHSGGDTRFSWDYEIRRDALAKLYRRAQDAQWKSADLPWDTEVDVERVVAATQARMGGAPQSLLDAPGTPFARWGDKEWLEFGVENQRWTLSQFLHGEQGALLCTSQLVCEVPDTDAKFYGATQVIDEARHVEVFARYLDAKLGGSYPINGHLQALLDDVLSDSRWDMTYLGMQIMVEGLALASFGFMRQLSDEPLLKELLRMVMSDEARHVAFGVMALKDFYDDLSDAEMLERQQFAFEAAVRMRDRLLAQEVYERMGVDVRAAVTATMGDPMRGEFQALLFSKIVPNCRKLGLLDRNGGWLRERFTELGCIQYEHATDTSEEYAEFDAVSQ